MPENTHSSMSLGRLFHKIYEDKMKNAVLEKGCGVPWYGHTDIISSGG